MNMASPHTHRSQGFSMIELMVALVLGLILMAGVISVYTTNKKSYSLNIALGQVQESGRFAFNYIEPPIRMAGFFGCAHTPSDSVGSGTNNTFQSILNSSSGTYFDSNSIEGYEYTGSGVGATLTLGDTPTYTTNAANWSPTFAPGIATAIGAITGSTATPVVGSDVLVLHEAAPGGISLSSPYTTNADGLFVAPGAASAMSISGIYVVTDCTASALFQVTNIANDNTNGNHQRVDHSSNNTMTPGNINPAHFSHAFKAGSQIMSYETYVFYIGKGADNGPSLYQISLGSTGAVGTPQELVPGIDTMQLLYGVDTDGDQIPNYYVTADNVPNWNQVVSVRVALLTRSDSNVTDSTPLTSFALLDPTAADGLTVKISGKTTRLREVFDETISIRNRLP